MKNTRFRRCALSFTVMSVLANPPGLFSGVSRAAPAAQMTSSGDAIEVPFVGEDGTQSKETIPVYHAGTIRYFSAGVGQEERTAPYPRFSLKIVFVAGAKAYLSQVAVTIVDASGKMLLDVPAEKVTGPWLFVDLPPGTYTLAGTGPSGARVHDRVTITTGQVKTVSLRWKAERTAQ